MLPGLLCLVLHLPAHAIGKELGVGVHPDRPIRLVSAKDSHAFAQRMLKGKCELELAPAHLARLAQKDQNGHLLARHDVTAQTCTDLQHALLACRSSVSEHRVAFGGQDLSTMDVYLSKTRLRLQTSANPVRPRL